MPAPFQRRLSEASRIALQLPTLISSSSSTADRHHKSSPATVWVSFQNELPELLPPQSLLPDAGEY